MTAPIFRPPPTLRVTDERAVLRYLELVAEAWQKREAAGVVPIEHRETVRREREVPAWLRGQEG